MENRNLEHLVTIHDRSQFEIRLNYDQDTSAKKNTYKVESFLFFPKSLRVDSHHYGKESFYKDLKTNIRLRTPAIAISKLVDSDDRSSLRVRIDEPFNRLLGGRARASDVDDIIYELKVFGTIFRGQVAEQANSLISLVEQENVIGLPTICDDIQKLLKIFVKELANAVSVFRKLRAKFLKPTIPAKLNLIFEEINEFLSLTIDTHLSRLVLAIKEVPGLKDTLGGSYTKQIQFLQKEARYREGAGYLSGNPLKNDGEKYIYRKSELKKSIMEVLFLRPKVQKEGSRTAQAVAMFAAGMAMLWALIALILGNSAFVINSTPFLLLMVFSYIVKDRIKDTIKNILNQKVLSRFLHDRKIEFYNHKTKKPMGHVRERFQFVDREHLPDDVEGARYPINSGKRFETIIQHDRSVVLFTSEFERLYSRIANVTRVSINNFLSKMDDSDIILPCYVHDEDDVKQVVMSKVYHIHLIIKLSTDPKNSILKHYRLVVNKEGIKRLESLYPDSSISSTSCYQPPVSDELHVEPEDFREHAEMPLVDTVAGLDLLENPRDPVDEEVTEVEEARPDES